jgi:hypothetical protein
VVASISVRRVDELLRATKIPPRGPVGVTPQEQEKPGIDYPELLVEYSYHLQTVPETLAPLSKTGSVGAGRTTSSVQANIEYETHTVQPGVGFAFCARNRVSI